MARRNKKIRGIGNNGKRLPTYKKPTADSQDQKTQLELTINRLLQRSDWAAASVLADQYLSKFGDVITYDLLVVLGQLFQGAKKFERSHELFIRALTMDGNRHEAPEALFWFYFEVGDKQANIVLDRLIEDGPSNRKKEYHYWRAVQANNASDFERVLKELDDAGGLPSTNNEHYSEVMYSYLMALCRTGDAKKAKEILDRLPDDVVNRSGALPMIGGQIWRSLERTDKAIEHYTGVLERFPALAEARWNRGLARLETGDLDGWDDYEGRWTWSEFPSKRKEMDVPQWAGEDLKNKKIVLWGEQGLGDQILFLTLALPIIRDPEVDVVIEVLPKIVDLVRAWYPEAAVEPLEVFDCRGMAAYESFDYHLPVGSLCSYFMRTPIQIQNRPLRMMRPKQEVRTDILSHTQKKDTSVVGICWRSSNISKSRADGYLNVNAVKTIALARPDIFFVSLQYGLTDEEIAVLHELDNVYVPDVDFYEDVFAHGQYVGSCDLVIAPRTLTLQLAGLFGINALSWGIDGWSFLGQRQYPWYPTIASLELDKDFSHSSLVYNLGRWLDIAIEHVDSRSA